MLKLHAQTVDTVAAGTFGVVYNLFGILQNLLHFLEVLLLMLSKRLTHDALQLRYPDAFE